MAVADPYEVALDDPPIDQSFDQATDEVTDADLAGMAPPGSVSPPPPADNTDAFLAAIQPPATPKKPAAPHDNTSAFLAAIKPTATPQASPRGPTFSGVPELPAAGGGLAPTPGGLTTAPPVGPVKPRLPAYSPPAPPHADATMLHVSLVRREDELSVQRRALETTAREIDLGNKLRQTRPLEFTAERDLAFRQKIADYEAGRHAWIAAEAQYKADRHRYDNLPATTVPPVPRFTYETPPAFSQPAAFKALQVAEARSAGPERAQALQQHYDVSMQHMGEAIRGAAAEIEARRRALELIAPQITALVKARDAGQLSPSTQRLLNQRLTEFQASAKLLVQQSTETSRRYKEFASWYKASPGRPIHTGRWFPWEVDSQGRPAADTSLLQRGADFLNPLPAIAQARAREIQAVMQKTGEYPPLPEPVGQLSQEQRDDLARKKNSLFDLVQREYNFHHPRPETTSHGFLGGREDVVYAGGQNQAIPHEQNRLEITRALASLTPYQQQLLPIVRKQYDAIHRSEQMAGTERAWRAGIGLMLTTELLGPEVASLATRGVLKFASPAFRALLAASALERGLPFAQFALRAGAKAFVGGAGGAAAGAVTGGVSGYGVGRYLGQPAPKALQTGIAAAKSGAVSGAVIGGALGVSLGELGPEGAAARAAAEEARFQGARPATGKTRPARGLPPGAEPPAAGPRQPTPPGGPIAPAAGPHVTDALGNRLPLRHLTPTAAAELAAQLAAVPGATPEQTQDAGRLQYYAASATAHEGQRLQPLVPLTDPAVKKVWGTKQKSEPPRANWSTLYEASVTAGKKKNQALQKKLESAAANYRRDWLYEHNQQQAPGHGGPPLQPPAVSPYRQMTEAERDQVGAKTRQVLLLQDYNNSTQFLDPASPGVVSISEINGATPANLAEIADQQFARAQAQAEIAFAAPPQPVAVPPEPAAQATPHGQALQQGEAQRLGLDQAPLAATTPASEAPTAAPAPARALTAAEGKTAQLLAERPGNFVTAAGLAKERNIQPATAERHLQELAARGAVSLPSGPQVGTPHYEYHPHRLYDLLNKEDQEPAALTIAPEAAAPAPIAATAPAQAPPVPKQPPVRLAHYTARAAAALLKQPLPVVSAPQLATAAGLSREQAGDALAELTRHGAAAIATGLDVSPGHYRVSRPRLAELLRRNTATAKPAPEAVLAAKVARPSVPAVATEPLEPRGREEKKARAAERAVKPARQAEAVGNRAAAAPVIIRPNERTAVMLREPPPWDVLPTPIKRWAVRLAPIIEQVVREFAAAGLTPAEAGLLGEVGLLLERPGESGVVMGVTITEPAGKRIYISPFVPNLVTGKEQTIATWQSEENRPGAIAAQLLQTIVHELAHLRSLSEGSDLGAIQKEIWANIPTRVSVRAQQRLETLLTGGEKRGSLARPYREARQSYLQGQRAGGGAGVREAGAGEPGAGPGGRQYRERRLPGGQGGTPGDARATHAVTPFEGPPEIQNEMAGFQATRKAYERVKAGVGEVLRQFSGEMWKTYPYLKTVEDANFIHLIDVQKRQRAISQLEAVMKVAEVTQDLTPSEGDLYEKGLFGLDWTEETARQVEVLKALHPEMGTADAEKEVRLPRGVTPEGIHYEWTPAKLRVLMNALSPRLKAPEAARVRAAIAVRRQVRKLVEEPYLDALKKVAGRKVDFDREEYVHHEILFYMNAMHDMQIGGQEPDAGRAAGRGHLKARHGSMLEHLTDARLADLFWYAPAIFDTAALNVLAHVSTHYDRTPALKAAALARNHQQAWTWANGEAARLNALRKAGEPTLAGEDVFRRQLQPGKEAGYWFLSQLAADGKLPDTPTGEWADVIQRLALNWFANQGREGQPGYIEFSGTPEEKATLYQRLGDYVTFMAAAGKRRPGVAAARDVAAGKIDPKEVLALLGKEHLTPADVVRIGQLRYLGRSHDPTGELEAHGFHEFADLVAWQPREGSAFYRSRPSIERVAERMAAEAMEGLGLAPESAAKAKDALMMGGPRPTYWIPERIQKTLDRLGETQIKHPVEAVLDKPGLWWRRLILFSPWRIIPYYRNNALGDIEAAFVLRPQTFKLAGEANALLNQLFKEKRLPALDESDAKRGITAANWPEFLEWLHLGGLKATFQQQFGTADSRVPFELLKAWDTPEPWLNRRVLAHLANSYGRWAEGVNDKRESILRLATYLSYRRELQAQVDAHVSEHGEAAIDWKTIKPSDYGASNPWAVDELEGVPAKAWTLSNEVMLAYDKVGQGMLQGVRQKVDLPFWTYREANQRRWGNALLNVWRGGSEYRRLVEETGMEMGLAVIRQALGPPKLPPPPVVPPGLSPGDPEWEGHQKRRAAYDQWATDEAERHRKSREFLREVLKNARRNPTVGRKIVYQAVWRAGQLALGAAAVGGAKIGWNRLQADRNENLPPYVRDPYWGATHMVLPGWDGQVWVMNTPSGITDSLDWFGIGDTIGWDELQRQGGWGISRMATHVFHSTVNEAFGQVGPLKTLLELGMGQTLYPDLFRPRPIASRTDYALDQLALGSLYRALTGKPQPPGKGFLNVLGINQYDPREMNYMEMRSWVGTWKQYQPGGQEPEAGGAKGTRSAALYWFQRYLGRGMKEAAASYLLDYLKNGGTKEGLRSHFQQLDFLHGLTQAQRRRFLLGGVNGGTGAQEEGLPPIAQAKLRQSYWYLVDMIPGRAIDAGRRNGLNEEPIERFVPHLQHLYRSRMHQYAAGMVRDLTRRAPEIKAEKRVIEKAKRR